MAVVKFQKTVEGRDFRFSTYATLVIRREMYRSIQRLHRNSTRFVTGQAELFEDQLKMQAVGFCSETQRRKVEDNVATMMENLDDREKLIVSARCGVIDLDVKATFPTQRRNSEFPWSEYVSFSFEALGNLEM